MNTRAIVVLLLALSGCASTDQTRRVYGSARVDKNAMEWRGYDITQGHRSVLENSRFVSALPFVVDGIAGYQLLIELSPPLLVGGNSIAIPSEGGKAYLHTLNAPSYTNVEPFGVVRVLEVKDAEIVIEVRLKTIDGNWAYSEIDNYRYAQLSCIGKADWACDFYAK